MIPNSSSPLPVGGDGLVNKKSCPEDQLGTLRWKGEWTCFLQGCLGPHKIASFEGAGCFSALDSKVDQLRSITLRNEVYLPTKN